MNRFVGTFNPGAATTILDGGGYPDTWKGLAVREMGAAFQADSPHSHVQ
jgi:hypothetical protein